MTKPTDLQDKSVQTIDLNFLGIPGVIAVYLIPHAHGAVMVECGPGSTIPALQAGLRAHGLTEADITDVLLTHIHLDHGGAAGWMARQGARIHVHPVGAPHLVNPDKLLASAARIYGEMMQTLWGEFLPVPEDRLSIVQDDDLIEIDGLQFRAIDTPGHANHHYAYLFEDLLFSGDAGGVRLPGPRHLRLPMPPPEFHLEKWRASVVRLGSVPFSRIAPTHFGIFSDPGWHLSALANVLNEVEGWMQSVMPANPSPGSLNEQFLEWTRQRSLDEGVGENLLPAYEAANPSWMSSQGIQRYWTKHRAGT